MSEIPARNGRRVGIRNGDASPNAAVWGWYWAPFALGLIIGLVWLPGLTALAQEAVYQGKNLSQWKVLLDQPDREGRLEAVRALGVGFGPQSVPVLINALADGDVAVRRETISALASIKPPAPEALSALAKSMKDPDPSVRRYAAAAMGDLGDVPALAQALKDPNKDVRRNAMRPLRRIVTQGATPSDSPKTKAAVAALAGVLKDPDADLRTAAARSLGIVGPAAADAIPALTEAAKDADPTVRGAAIEALRRVRNTRTGAQSSSVSRTEDNASLAHIGADQ